MFGMRRETRMRGAVQGCPTGLFQVSRHEFKSDLRHTRKYAKEELRQGGNGFWQVWDTQLSEYAAVRGAPASAGKMLDFEKYLLGKISDGKTRVLDIGIGSGRQWIEFLRENKLEFSGTALEMQQVDVRMREYVKICSAAELHANYPKGNFDVVVSHYGTHGQQLGALDNIMWALKKGGEAIVSGSGGMPWLENPKAWPMHYAIIGQCCFAQGQSDGRTMLEGIGASGRMDDSDYAPPNWFYHIKKN